ncbi:MAG: hypothetical protein V2B18_17830 [Pseudomonadota bacterium]
MANWQWKTGRRIEMVCLGTFLFLVLTIIHGIMSGSDHPMLFAGEVSASQQITASQAAQPASGGAPPEQVGQSRAGSDPRLNKIEELVAQIKTTGERAESRTYHIKQVGSEVIRLVEMAVIVLVVIAAAFPIAIWLLSRKTKGTLQGLSPEMEQTLTEVEERQARLVRVLKELQNEIDYVHSMSVPELNDLVKRAEEDLQLNEKDLTNVGLAKTAAGTTVPLRQ